MLGLGGNYDTIEQAKSDVELMMTREEARICDSCIDKSYEAIQEHRTKK